MRTKCIFQFATLMLSGFCVAQAASFTLGPSASVGVIVGNSSTEQILAGGRVLGLPRFQGFKMAAGRTTCSIFWQTPLEGRET
jgi:hypothetical protein